MLGMKPLEIPLGENQFFLIWLRYVSYIIFDIMADFIVKHIFYFVHDGLHGFLLLVEDTEYRLEE